MLIGLSFELGIGLPEIETWSLATVQDYMAYLLVPQEAIDKAATEEWFTPPAEKATAEELEAARKLFNNNDSAGAV